MDALHRFLFEQLDIRGVLVQLGGAWRDMLARRDYAPPVRDLLGELAAVTAVIGGNLKSENRLSFQLQGRGPVALLVMDCQPVSDGPLRLRGMARVVENGAVPPALSLPLVAPLLGDGQLVLTLNQSGNQAYQSYVPLDGERLAEVFEHYLAQSEQQPARLWLFASEQHACALFLQTLPGAHERDEDGWNRVVQLAATVKPDELTLPPETLLGRLFAEEDVRLYAPRAIQWHCPRDEDKVRDMLGSLGRAEVESMLAEHGHIEINDEICGHTYRFGPEIVEQLFPTPGRTLH